MHYFNDLQLFTYTSDIDYEEFYKKWIPKECLPSDFGGDLPTVVEMNANFRKEFDELRDYFLAEEAQRTNSTDDVKENSKTNNIESIRIQNLEID